MHASRIDHLDRSIARECLCDAVLQCRNRHARAVIEVERHEQAQRFLRHDIQRRSRRE